MSPIYFPLLQRRRWRRYARRPAVEIDRLLDRTGCLLNVSNGFHITDVAPRPDNWQSTSSTKNGGNDGVFFAIDRQKYDFLKSRENQESLFFLLGLTLGRGALLDRLVSLKWQCPAVERVRIRDWLDKEENPKWWKTSSKKKTWKLESKRQALCQPFPGQQLVIFFLSQMADRKIMQGLLARLFCLAQAHIKVGDGSELLTS